MDEALVSFDVTSLFANTLQIRQLKSYRKLVEKKERTPLSPERIAELLQLCLNTTYFSYNGEFYEQRQGAAMGTLSLQWLQTCTRSLPYCQLRQDLDFGSGMWMIHNEEMPWNPYSTISMMYAPPSSSPWSRRMALFPSSTPNQQGGKMGLLM